MTQIDLSKLVFESSFSGLGNSTTQSLAFNVPSTNLSGGPVLYTFSAPLTNETSITQQEIQLTGIDVSWYILKGSFETFYDASNNFTNGSGSAMYAVGINGGYTGTNYVINVQLFPFSGATPTNAAFTLNINLSLYTTPF